MLTVMSLRAAREGALLPGRKGNRVRLGREGRAVSKAFTAPSSTSCTNPHFSTNSRKGRIAVPRSNPGLSCVLASHLGDPAGDIFNTASSRQPFWGISSHSAHPDHHFFF